MTRPAPPGSCGECGLALRWEPGQSLALTYFLPEPVIAGDVKILETGSTTVVSDWLRFTDTAGHINAEATGAGSRMLFYSEKEAGETNAELADQTFPTNLGLPGTNTVTITEVGVEGNNGFDYRPGGPVCREAPGRHERAV